MKKVSLNIKTIIIFVCVLLKYLIEYGVNTYILYSAVIVILFFEFLRTGHSRIIFKYNTPYCRLYIFYSLKQRISTL